MRYVLLGIALCLAGCDPADTPDSKRAATKNEWPNDRDSPTPTPVEHDGAAEPKQPPTDPPKPATVQNSDAEPKEVPPEDAPPVPESYKPLNKAKSLFFEKNGDVRKVHLMAEVCLREGPLEVLLCKMNTKEHESILHVDADAREIHFALIAAGAQPGTPVKFVPVYTAATGTKIKVSLTYREKGKVKTVTAQDWIKDKKTGKNMAHEWVFAGSKFFKDPDRPNASPYYMANNGEIISLANFPDSMMDLPVKSPKEALNLIYEINNPLIPPLKTPVLITFEPVLDKK